MLEKDFEDIYLQFRANYYRRMVQEIGVREGSLSATEGYCVEIIYLMNKPTVKQFADFLNISMPNANYKINSLIVKGYVTQTQSSKDRRESHLAVTDKFLSYYGLNDEYNAQLMSNIRKTFTADEVSQLEKMLEKVLALMSKEEK